MPVFEVHHHRHLSGFHKQVDDQPDEQLLVGRETFGHQQGQGCQRGIADPQGHAFMLQIDEKEKRADAFVAVGKRMVHNNEIEQMCRPEA